MLIKNKKIAIYIETKAELEKVMTKLIKEIPDIDREDMRNDLSETENYTFDWKDTYSRDNKNIYQEDYKDYKLISGNEYLGKKTEPEKFLVTWDEKDQDPCEYFINLKDAKEKIKKLLECDNVYQETIRLVEIKNISEIKQTFSLNKIK